MTDLQLFAKVLGFLKQTIVYSNEEMARLDELKNLVRDRLAQPVQAIDMSEKHVHISDKDRHEWGLVTDDALIEEVRRRGFTIRDAQISPKVKDEYELCCQKYDTCTEPCTPRGRHLAKREWVGLTDKEWYMIWRYSTNLKNAIEEKLREKNNR